MTETETYILERYAKDLTFYENDFDFFASLSEALKTALRPALGPLCMIVCLVVAAAAVKAFSDSVSSDGAPFTMPPYTVFRGSIYLWIR